MTIAYHYGWGRHTQYLSDYQILNAVKWISVSQGMGVVAPALGRISFCLFVSSPLLLGVPWTFGLADIWFCADASNRWSDFALEEIVIACYMDVPDPHQHGLRGYDLYAEWCARVGTLGSRKSEVPGPIRPDHIWLLPVWLQLFVGPLPHYSPCYCDMEFADTDDTEGRPVRSSLLEHFVRRIKHVHY